MDMIFAFDYPITKPFPTKWGSFLLAFGVLSAAALTAVNVFLVGYDVISITTNNPNTTHGVVLPWPSQQDFGCAPHQFQLCDTFRTSISAFSYSIFDVLTNSDAGASAIHGAFLYANNNLSSCDVVQYEIDVKPGDRLVTASATIQCPPPLGLQAVTSWSYSNHPIIGGISPAIFPENSLARAIIDGMNNVSAEAYWDIWNKQYTTNTTNGQDLTQEIYKVIAQGQPKCDPNPPFACAVPQFTNYNAIGNTDLNILPGPSSIPADINNLQNVISILYAAVRLDLGHWTPDNLFINTTSFKTQILSTNIPADTYATTPSISFRSLASTKGMAYVNFTTPPPATVRTPAAVIQMQYTCNVMQRKPMGSFIVSVLSSTLSMFLGAWGGLLSILSAVVRKKAGANTCEPRASTVRDEYHAHSVPLVYTRGSKPDTDE
ncbi:hypothetical protein DFH09DRAFT_1341289 [Mycena vulgaris]|nr:hypothetical protein DFH09DRAFT_1341289 [Mycena vulgaris]